MIAQNDIAGRCSHRQDAIESGSELPRSRALHVKVFTPPFAVRRYFAAFATRTSGSNTPP